MSILVTGGAGFIGSHLINKLLEEGHSVICLDNFDSYYDSQLKKKNIVHNLSKKNFKLIEADVRDKKALERIFKENDIEKIVHLAAKVGVRPSIKEPLLYEDVNVRGTLNLLELCKEHKVGNFIFGSSSSVYGNIEKVPFSEDDVPKPISPYGASKRSAELLCHVYSSLYGIPITCLRFFTVYGPRQRPDMAIHKFTKLIDQGKEIQMYGDGTSKRDYTYISDIVTGIVNALKKGFPLEIFNLGNSRIIELKEIISVIENELGEKAMVRKLPIRPGDMPITYANISKARKLLDYNPQVSLEAGIKAFIKWYKTKRED
ncbi:UDP-N-acetylglucosamine 4-epimerase [subsurface metagenome]